MACLRRRNRSSAPRSKGKRFRRCCSVIVLLSCGLSWVFPALFILGPVQAQTHPQIEQPDRKYLFLEDKHQREKTKEKREELKARRQAAEQQQNLGQMLPFDINAGTLTYDQSGNVVNAEGDVIITYGALVAEAQKASVNIRENKAELSGDVRISDVSANLVADNARLNVEDGTGVMENVDIFFTEGEYKLFAREATRKTGESYAMKNAVMSTCQCPNEGDCLPWSLRAEEAEITRNGYGEAWDTTLTVRDVPVFYFPYLFFPAKTERQSGLLPATYGQGRESGFDLEVPLYLVLDRSSDMTVTGLYESKIHSGAQVEYRRAFSRQNELETGHIYLNESERGGDLLGTNVQGIFDPTLDTNRYGGWLDHSWNAERLQYIMRGRYVSDDLFAREYDNDNIAPYNSRFVTSQAVLRAPIFQTFSADLLGEYNQSLVSDDDFVFQRAPELNITGNNSFNPFGENPLGLRLVSNTELSSIYFTRAESYSGARSEAVEKLRVPFHVRNYFDGTVEGNMRASQYDMTDGLVDPLDPVYENFAADEAHEFPSTSSRVIPSFNATLNSVVEKVFEVPEESLLKKIGELGSIGRYQELVRVKHTIEPSIRYRIIPNIDQTDNPIFDSYDRLDERNVVTYGVTQRLYGRYNARNEYVYGIEETAPEIADIGGLKPMSPLDQRLNFGLQPPADGGDYSQFRRGSITELVNLKLYQSYDMLAASDDNDPDRSPLSDLGGLISLFPNEHVILRSDMNLDVEEGAFRSYSLQAMLTSKRGDSVRSGLRFVEDNVRQLESAVELRLTEHVKVGYYSRYDDLTQEFIEQKGGLRFSSACRCWIFDLYVSDKLNPDETKLAFNITLIGLGQVGNTFFSASRDSAAE